MSFLDQLISSSEASEASLIKFFQFYKPKENCIHLFFEGSEDQSFYMNFIDQIYGASAKKYIYICNGKANVYQNYCDISWKAYSKNRVLFFTDRDYDTLLMTERQTDENIFVTKYYSVENYIVNEYILERLLREFCYINEESIIEPLLKKFKEEYRIFTAAMIGISSWIVYCRQNDLRLNLGDIELSKLFFLKNDFSFVKHPSSVGGFRYVCRATNSSHFNLSEIRKIYSKLKALEDPKLFIRGKFELWYLYVFYINTLKNILPQLNKLIKDHNRTSKVKRNRCKIMVSITPDNLLLLAGPKLNVPDDLSQFLHQNHFKYEAAVSKDVTA